MVIFVRKVWMVVWKFEMYWVWFFVLGVICMSCVCGIVVVSVLVWVKGWMMLWLCLMISVGMLMWVRLVLLMLGLLLEMVVSRVEVMVMGFWEKNLVRDVRLLGVFLVRW